MIEDLSGTTWTRAISTANCPTAVIENALFSDWQEWQRNVTAPKFEIFPTVLTIYHFQNGTQKMYRTDRFFCSWSNSQVLSNLTDMEVKLELCQGPTQPFCSVSQKICVKLQMRVILTHHHDLHKILVLPSIKQSTKNMFVFSVFVAVHTVTGGLLQKKAARKKLTEKPLQRKMDYWGPLGIALPVCCNKGEKYVRSCAMRKIDSICYFLKRVRRERYQYVWQAAVLSFSSRLSDAQR